MTAASSLIALVSQQIAGPTTRLGIARAGTLVLDLVIPPDTVCSPHRTRGERSRRSTCASGSRRVSAPDEPRGSRRVLKSP